MKNIEIYIPNLGEAEETEVIEISVQPGQKIKSNDPLIVLESEKAAMEVPSDHDGIVKQINIKEGDSVKEGQLFAILEVESKQAEDSQNIIEKIATPSIKENKREVFEQTTNFSGINAGPAVRKVARELEIDLSKIDGTGKNSLITKEDLKNFIHSSSKASTSYANIESLKEFGDYEITDQSKIRSLGARNLTESWTSIPHVTHFEEIDITEIEKQRAELNKNSKIKITPVAYVAVKVIAALKEYPLLNSSLVGEGKVMLRNYYNLGIAVDTVGGLLVPVVKDADNLDINGLASEIADLAEKAKKKKLLEKNLKGGTFSISSLGPMGGTGFTPIINPPEVAILGISRAKKTPMIENNQLIERTILPVALSYDHRVINGADAGKFMNFLKAEIEKGL